MGRMRLGVAAALVGGELVPGDLEVEDGRVAGVGLSPSGEGLAVPGFVDLQVNGFGGVDFLSAEPEDFEKAGAALLATGVTAYQPTLVTAPVQAMVRALEVVGEAAARVPGPRILGAHLEGPFLSPKHAGAHPHEYLVAPDRDVLVQLLQAGPVSHVTLAPELPGALGLIDVLMERGVTVALGHSDADARTAHLAFERGARAVTHLFNAMRPLHHRDPGIAGVALSRADVLLQVIADGIHLAPETLLLTWRAGPGRLALVTDAIAAAGCGAGTFRLGAMRVRVLGSEARRADGRLAGSVLSMDQAVRNLVQAGVPMLEALGAATRTPGRLVDGRAGIVEEGSPADLVVLDEELQVTGVWVSGEKVR